VGEGITVAVGADVSVAVGDAGRKGTQELNSITLTSAMFRIRFLIFISPP
jgi:hypothetical protein